MIVVFELTFILCDCFLVVCGLIIDCFVRCGVRLLVVLFVFELHGLADFTEVD